MSSSTTATATNHDFYERAYTDRLQDISGGTTPEKLTGSTERFNVKNLADDASSKVTGVLDCFQEGMAAAYTVVRLIMELFDRDDLEAHIDSVKWSGTAIFRQILLGRDMLRYGRGFMGMGRTDDDVVDPRIIKMYDRANALLSCSLLHPRPVVLLVAALAEVHHTLQTLVTTPPPQFRHQLAIFSELMVIIPTSFVLASHQFHRGRVIPFAQSKAIMCLNVVSRFGASLELANHRHTAPAHNAENPWARFSPPS